MRFAMCSIALVLAGGLPAAQPPGDDERTAMEAVVKAGGKATIDPKLAAGSRVAARFDSLSDAGLLGLKKHAGLGAIDILDSSKCTDKGLAALKDLPNLRRLVLGPSELNLAAATAIGRCKELRYLGLVEAGLTDAELAGLKTLTLLEHLSLSNNPKVTDKGMLTVKGFERMRELYLANTGITDKGLAELKGLDGLRTLNLANTKVTASAAEKFIDEMPNLRSIRH